MIPGGARNAGQFKRLFPSPTTTIFLNSSNFPFLASVNDKIFHYNSLRNGASRLERLEFFHCYAL